LRLSGRGNECSLKAFLEHDLELGAVADRFPEDRAS
jgi:hypothetical protein